MFECRLWFIHEYLFYSSWAPQHVQLAINIDDTQSTTPTTTSQPDSKVCGYGDNCICLECRLLAMVDPLNWRQKKITKISIKREREHWKIKWEKRATDQIQPFFICPIYFIFAFSRLLTFSYLTYMFSEISHIFSMPHWVFSIFPKCLSTFSYKFPILSRLLTLYPLARVYRVYRISHVFSIF